uniref:Uncharacterized protein n=2 Tax=Avena sativa TaxID=4498 RepID=A0ACD5UW69_AVESA
MATGSSTTQISLASEVTEGAISFDRLMQITDDFSKEREIGAGALGTVYKGIIDGGGVIAVKRHVGNAIGTHNRAEHKAKVQSLMEKNHENVARLLAFCYENRNEVRKRNGRNYSHHVVESLLCYEYLPKGSLHKNLFGDLATIFDWNARFKIIKGICEGVRFLHKSCPPILHLDLKPQNVLFDDNMVPKITDFTYSRLLGEKETRMITKSSLGSVGYKAPEYLDHGEISTRTDIYSLGLMILEIATREKNCPNADRQSARDYVKKVKAEWTNHERILTEYPDLPQGCRDQLNACIEIGLKCVNLNQNKRLKIVEIVNKLNGH